MLKPILLNLLSLRNRDNYLGFEVSEKCGNVRFISDFGNIISVNTK